MKQKENKKIIINIPIYKDWDSVTTLIHQIDREISVLTKRHDHSKKSDVLELF